MKGNKFMYCLKTTHNWRLCTLGKAFTATFRRIFFFERLKVHHCTIHGVFFLETSTTLCKHGIYTSTLIPTLHWPILIQITIQIMPSSLHCRALKSSDITGQYWHRLILSTATRPRPGQAICCWTRTIFKSVVLQFILALLSNYSWLTR